jgi:hypothetical protein
MIRSELGLPGTTFDFNGRNRRPPRNVVNCLLSFGYALLTKDLTAITYAVGFNPYLGFYHRPRFGQPALALDLAEGLDHQPPDSRAREDDVRPFDLPVHVLGRPVEHGGEQLAEDLLSGAFGNATEAIALDEVSSTEVGEARPSCADAVTASLSRTNTSGMARTYRCRRVPADLMRVRGRLPWTGRGSLSKAVAAPHTHDRIAWSHAGHRCLRIPPDSPSWSAGLPTGISLPPGLWRTSWTGQDEPGGSSSPAPGTHPPSRRFWLEPECRSFDQVF